MNISDDGKKFIKSFEGCRLTAYPDPATRSDPWTIGWGDTGPDVREGLTITQDEADARFDRKISQYCISVNNLLKVQVTQNMFDALVSFSYNCGMRNLANSTLLRLINENNIGGASRQFLLWNRANGRVMDGLTKRRQEESKLFLGIA